MATVKTVPKKTDLIADLKAIVGEAAVATDLAQRTFFSTDIAASGQTAQAVVRPGDTEALSRVVGACTRGGRGVVPRGGGFSYTGGYTPQTPDAVIIDMRGMDRIVEINSDDMYVVVETGCTWQKLYEALKAKGLRTPYFGPMSGARATVGGALSQGSFFLGSTQYGAVADSVLGLEVVLADGAVLRTGSWASQGAAPFYRQYGPDLTSLFLSDTGAMGFKSRAVLRLIPFPPHQAYASFAFTTHEQALAAVSAIGRSGLAAECYCWDPLFVRLMAAAASSGLSDDLGILLNVIKGGSNLLDGLIAAARIALAGRGVFKGDTWLMHVTMDDASGPGAAAKLHRVRALARKAGGSEVSPTAPRAMRASPFIDFNTAERRIPRRNLPVHGVMPHSRGAAVAADIYALVARHRPRMEQLGMTCGVIMIAVGTQAVTIEPLLSWEDQEHFLHNRVTEISDLDGLSAYTERPEATAFGMQVKKELIALFRKHGCIHVQIARSYPWAQTLEPENLKLIAAFKDAIDPHGLVNRGSLGLGADA